MRSWATWPGAWMMAAVFVLGYVVVFIAIHHLLVTAGHPTPVEMTWWKLRVPGLDRSFGDLRSLTHGVECWQRGIDPYGSNPCDPWGRLVNYPPVWLWLFDWLGVGPRATVWLGAGFGIAFVIAAIAFVSDRPAWQGAIYGAALTSPAVLMGIERGNNDYLMFTMTVAGIGLLMRHERSRQWGGAALLLSATVLKLFPVFAAAIVLLRRRSLLLPVLTVVAASAVYFVANCDILDLISRNTHREVFYSYGAVVIFDGLERYFGVTGMVAAWTTPALVVTGVAGVALGLLLSRNDVFALSDDRFGAGFAFAAALYLFSFSFERSFDYRLAFLLLALPQLMDWAASRDGAVVQRTMAALAVGAIVISLYLSYYTVKLRLIDEVFNWITFVLLAATMTVVCVRFATTRT